MEVGILLDTSAYSAFNRRDERLRQWINATQQLVVPSIVLGELRAGFAAGSQTERNEVLLRRFLDAPRVSVIHVDDQTTHLYAQIYAALRRAGTPMGTNDMWIASLALQHDLSLLTLDSDYTRVPDLMLIEL